MLIEYMKQNFQRPKGFTKARKLFLSQKNLRKIVPSPLRRRQKQRLILSCDKQKTTASTSYEDIQPIGLSKQYFNGCFNLFDAQKKSLCKSKQYKKRKAKDYFPPKDIHTKNMNKFIDISEQYYGKILFNCSHTQPLRNRTSDKKIDKQSKSSVKFQKQQFTKKLKNIQTLHKGIQKLKKQTSLEQQMFQQVVRNLQKVCPQYLVTKGQKPRVLGIKHGKKLYNQNYLPVQG